MDYKVQILDPFGIVITRISDGQLIFDSTREAFVYSKYYLTIGTTLPEPNPNIYGLGERVHNFRLDPSTKTYTIFNRDQFNIEFKNLYGSHPFHVEKRRDKAHGIFFFNSNAMDVTIKPYGLNYKTIGGVLDFFFFMGPQPEDVIKQYHEVVGKPVMIPYWSLGFHHCRWGYKDINITKDVVDKYRQNQIPLEVMWNDIDYMDKFKLFTFDPVKYPVKEVNSFVKDLHAKGQKYVMIVDPGVKVESGYDVYEDGLKENLYITKEDGKTPALNKVWPGITAFPDFTNKKTHAYWEKYMKKFHDDVPYDGIWLDMNEIVGFCDGECTDKKKLPSTKKEEKSSSEFDPDRPPYVPGGEKLYTKTIWLKSKTSISTEYDTHSLYAHLENQVTRVALDKILKKRSLIVTRSSWAGTGHVAGKWLGDNESKWRDMFLSISGMLSMNLFGIPYIGADICGFMGNTTEELCTRWYQIGAFYPFSRNHNEINASPQEPWVFGDQFVRRARSILNHRYALLPYYYTLFYHAHISGGTVIKSLPFEFNKDQSRDINFLDRQFMVGSALLISPVLDNGARQVNAYFPEGDWYDYFTGIEVEGTGRWHTLPAPIDHIPVHIRGGYIVPRQAPALTTRDARKNPFNILVALNSALNAKGDLYLDDGESLDSVTAKKYTLIEFEATSGKLTSRHIHQEYDVSSSFVDIVRIMGAQNVCNVFVNGKETRKFRYDPETQLLEIYEQELYLHNKFEITWTCQD